MKPLFKNSSSVVEAGDHFKNGASPKSQMSRRIKIWISGIAIMLNAATGFTQEILNGTTGQLSWEYGKQTLTINGRDKMLNYDPMSFN